MRGGYTQIGAASGLVQASLAANQLVDLQINSTNAHGDTPAYEWFLFTAAIAGNAIPVYVISDKGVFDLNQVLSNLFDYTFPFDKDGVTYIGTMSMSDLGLQTGDTFVYGYAYMNLSGVVVIDNVVIISVN